MNPTILRRQQYLPECRKSSSSKCCRNNGNSKCCSYKAVPAIVVGTTVIASFNPTRIVGTAVPASVVGITANGRYVPARFGGTAVPTRLVGTAVPTINVLTAYYWKSCGGEGQFLRSSSLFRSS